MTARRRRWLVALAVAIGVGVGGFAIGLVGSGSSTCVAAVVGAGDVPPVFAPVDSPVVATDSPLKRLIAAVQSSGFGRVIGAVGYEQSQWLRSAAVAGGFASWTAGNAVIGFRDRLGRVRWGLRQTGDPQAWAVVGPTFVNLDLRPGKHVRVGGYDSVSGASRWCADVGSATKYGDPLTVAAGSAGSLWVVTAGPTLSHVEAAGPIAGHIAMTGVDRAAFVKQIGSLVIVGGRASTLLTAPDPKVPRPGAGAPAITAFDAASLSVRWRWGRGLTAHVVGESGGLVLVDVRHGSGLTLLALDLAGHQRWSVDLPKGTTADVTLRGSRPTVLVRSDRMISGHAVSSGARRWTRIVGMGGLTFPYGFDLAAQPNLGDQVLLGTTSALVELDPVTGRVARYPLPSDGSLPTFWPYEIAVSGRSAVVETNAGAVLVALRPRA